jgi:LysM repeat protein
MEKRTSAVARIFALLALVGAVVAVVVVVAGSAGGGSSSPSHHRGSGHLAKKETARRKATPAIYIVKTGDRLISISFHTGVPVSRILALNPEVDPQILTAGEKLKLR